MTCTPPQIVYQRTCVDQCPPTFFNNSGYCQACTYPCHECTTVSTSSCLSCKPTYFLDPNGMCLSACPMGTYRNNATWTCSNCPVGCMECESLTWCRQCNNSYYYIGGTCVTTCPPGFYSIPEGVCRGCHYACATCTGPQQWECLSCRSTYVWSAPGTNKCVDRCPKGMYIFGEYCTKCPNNCSDCNSNGTCLSCPDREKSNGMCCPFGNFYNPTSGQCEACDPTCKVCSDSSLGSCTLCDNSRGSMGGLPVLGTCMCREGGLETLEPACPRIISDSRSKYMSFTQGFVLASLMMTSIMATFAKQRVVFLKLLDFCQISSLYLYVNLIYPYSLDWALGMMRYANIEPLFQHIYKPSQQNYTLEDIRKVGISPIYIINNQIPDSLKTTVYMLCLNIIGWTVVGILSLFNSMMTHHSAPRALLRSVLRKVQYSMIDNLLNLSIVTFVVAAIVNFKHADLSTRVGVASMATSTISCLYIVGWLGICVKNILSQNKNFGDLTAEQTNGLSKASRLYEPVAMLRKILLSAAVVLLFERTTAQLSTAIAINAAFMLYTLVWNPYGPFYKLFDVLCELGNAAIAGGILWLSFEPRSMEVARVLGIILLLASGLFLIASTVENFRKPMR